jgi:hypothetical protein
MNRFWTGYERGIGTLRDNRVQSLAEIKAELLASFRSLLPDDTGFYTVYETSR